MKVFVSTLLFATVMVVHAVKDNVLLGSVSSSSSSQFGSGSTQTQYENVNGVQTRVTRRTTYEQKADGSCVRKTVEERNGKTAVSEVTVDCNQAKKDVQRQGEETQREINKSSKKLNEDIERENRRIQESIAKQMREMNSHFGFF